MKAEQKHVMLSFFLLHKLNLVVKLVTTGSKYSKLSVEQYFCHIRSCQQLYSRLFSLHFTQLVSSAHIFNNFREGLLLKQFLMHPLKTSQRNLQSIDYARWFFQFFDTELADSACSTCLLESVNSRWSCRFLQSECADCCVLDVAVEELEKAEK